MLFCYAFHITKKGGITVAETEKLLEKAEKVLYFVSCAVPLARIADSDVYGAEIDCVLETVAEMAESVREEITNALLMMHIARRKAEV